MLLALALAAGDTASLILTAGATQSWFGGLDQPIAALTPLIYNNFFQSYANSQEDAWGATLVLLLMILVLNLVARLGFARRARAGEAS
jgi:phosphate transport system permease protein